MLARLRRNNRWNKEMWQFTIVFGRVRTFEAPRSAHSLTIRLQSDSDTLVIFFDGSSAIFLNLTGSVNSAYPGCILGNVVSAVALWTRSSALVTTKTSVLLRRVVMSRAFSHMRAKRRQRTDFPVSKTTTLFFLFFYFFFKLNVNMITKWDIRPSQIPDHCLCLF